MSEYVYQTDRPLFQYKLSEHLPRDTYSMHVHSAYELIYFLDGDATHVIEDRKYKLKKGDLILIRPFQYHFIQIDSTSRYERYNALFDPELHGVKAVTLIPDDVDIISLDGNVVAEDIFRRCELYRRSCSEEMFTQILPHLLSELFYHLYVFPNAPASERLFASPILSKALQYINENLFSIRDVSQIAEHLFVSESYLFRLFKKELHQTPKQYICEKRLLMAQKMLASGERPSKVYLTCGFSDYTTFYRNYKSFFGHAPTQNESLPRILRR